MYSKQSVSRSLLPAASPETSRRTLLKGSAAGGLVVGLTLVSGRGFAAAGSPGAARRFRSPPIPIHPSPTPSCASRPTTR